MSCKVGSILSEATYLSHGTIYCRYPSGAKFDAGYHAIELAINGKDFVRAGAVRVIPAASIVTDAFPDFGALNGGTQVSIVANSLNTFDDEGNSYFFYCVFGSVSARAAMIRMNGDLVKITCESPPLLQLEESKLELLMATLLIFHFSQVLSTIMSVYWHAPWCLLKVPAWVAQSA